MKIFSGLTLKKNKNRKILKEEKSLRGKFEFQNRHHRLLSFNEITKGLRKEFNVPEN